MVAVLVLGGCGLLPQPPSPLPTFREGFEAIPGPGYIHLITEPPTAPRRLTIGSAGDDGQASSITQTFADGSLVVVDLTHLPGASSILVDGVGCDGAIPVEVDRETDVVLRLLPDRCTVTVLRIHEAGVLAH